MPRERYQQPTLQRTNSGAWFIRPWVDVIEAGQILRRQRTINLGDAQMGKREAQALARQTMETINRAAYMVQSQVEFGYVITKYRDEHLPELSASTRAKYAQHLKKHIEPALKKHKLYEIDGPLVTKWIKGLVLTVIKDEKPIPKTTKDGEEIPLSWSTKNDIRNLMSGIFEKAKQWKLYKDENPIVNVHVGRKRLVRAKKKLTDEQTRKLLAALPGDVRIMASVALFSGLRISEVLGLQEKHFDFAASSLKIEQRYYRGDLDEAKSQKAERTVPVGYMADDVAMLLTGDPERFIFHVTTHRGTKAERLCRDDNSIRRYFLRPAAEKIGCYATGFGFHSLRREAVTAFNASLGVTQAMKLAGHATAEQSAEYTLEDSVRQDRAVRDRQEKILGEVKNKEV